MANQDYNQRDNRGDQGQDRYTTLGGNEGQVRHRGREAEANYVGGPGFGNYGYGSGAPGYGNLQSHRDDSVGFSQDDYRGRMYDRGARDGSPQQRGTGQFAGRGPKGWTRKDDRILEDVCQRLTDHPDIDASEIEVKVENGEVTLTGHVDSRQVKRMAEDVAEHVSGVRDIHNQLRVQLGLSDRIVSGSPNEQARPEQRNEERGTKRNPLRR
jgi:osmotically-inducible protein OsmY